MSSRVLPGCVACYSGPHMKDILKWVVFGCLFAVPFLTLYVENDYFFPFITGKNFWFRIIVDLAVVAYIGLALYEPKYRPQWSWILGGSAALLVVMFFANLFGEHPQSSFWSNFERMDGYVSLVHTYLYMLILGSVLKTKTEWKWLLNTSLVVSVLVAVGGLAQYFDVNSIIQLYNIGANSGRLDSTLGNAAYMAVYMLFHIFIVVWLFVESKSIESKIVYGALLPMFTFVLVETGTRGTAIGLAVGVLVMSAYIGLFASQFKEFRKYAIGGFIAIALAIGGFIAFKDSNFIQSQPNLARIANISMDDLRIRTIIWGMAWEGVEERPVLGWGQSNFNYVFNQNYDARLYGQEQWFDRSHNIFMDWLITGGFLGLFAYLSIFAACIYYLFWLPLRHKDESFTALERGILLGLLVGYFTHNLVVFDNIVSYIFFAIILGYIHSRVSKPFSSPFATKKVDEAIVTQAYVPVGIAAFIALVYFVHAPGMAAAGDIIKAFRSLQPSIEQGVQQPPAGPEVMLEHFTQALDRNSFAYQEITEQISQQAMGLARSPQVPEDIRVAFASTSEAQLQELVERKPNDARIHVFIASYYRATNQIDLAAEEMARARELSPDKQAIINQQGFIEMARGQNEAARDFFKTSFELDEDNFEAREYYAASLLYLGDIEGAVALMDSERAEERFAQSDFLFGAARQAGATDLLMRLYEKRIELNPNQAQNWASLAFLYFEQGDLEQAVETLREGGEQIVEFAPAAECIATNIEAGEPEPQAGC